MPRLSVLFITGGGNDLPGVVFMFVCHDPLGVNRKTDHNIPDHQQLMYISCILEYLIL